MSTELATVYLQGGGKTDIQFVPQPIGEGGMKRVYFTADRKSVLCFFKDQQKAAEPANLERLESLLAKWNLTADAQHGAYFFDLFCWPTAIVFSQSFGLGVMTPVYQKNFFFATGRWKGKEKEGKWFSSPKLRKQLPPEERGDWLGYLRLCILMARGIRKMHMFGLAHSDLSCRNVLVDPVSGKCAIIDVDSLVVPGKHPPDVLGTPNYIAPEVLATLHLPTDQRCFPSNLTDLHALAVLFYEYLLRRHPLKGRKVNAKPDKKGVVDPGEDDRLSFGEKALFIEHPSDKSNPPDDPIKVPTEALGSYLHTLFVKAFVDGLHHPLKRPSASAWEDGLCKTADLLIPCGNKSCEEKWFTYRPGHKPICPWCGWQLTQRTPILEFNYAPRPGQFRPEGHCLVAWNQRPLNLWHITTDVKPVEGVNKDTQAYVAFHQNQWLLINKNLESMVSPSGNPVPKGQACLLKEGDDILLSKEAKGRLVTVKYIP